MEGFVVPVVGSHSFTTAAFAVAVVARATQSALPRLRRQHRCRIRYRDTWNKHAFHGDSTGDIPVVAAARGRASLWRGTARGREWREEREVLLEKEGNESDEKNFGGTFNRHMSTVLYNRRRM